MSSIEKMELVDITGPIASLDPVLRIIANAGCFHMETASKHGVSGTEQHSYKEENPYTAPLKMLAEITALCGMKYSARYDSEANTPDAAFMQSEISKLKKKAGKLKNEISDAATKLTKHKQALMQVEHLLGLDVDFQRLFNCEHIKIRFGKLPVDSYKKLEYYDDKIFYFLQLSHDDEYYWGVYFTPLSVYEEVDMIFDSLYYERIRIPDFVHGNSEDAVKDLKTHIEKYEERKRKAEEELSWLIAENQDKLDIYFTRLKGLHDSFDLRNKVNITKEKFYIVGYVPTSDKEGFEKLFSELSDITIMMKTCGRNDKTSPPVKLKNGKFSEPFGMFVEMYGLPAYNGMNPASLVAVTYTILFGLMFGDLGHGLCVSIIGALLWKFKKLRLGAVMARIGLSGAFFGTLYGSIFGFEHLLDPVYEGLGISFLPFHAMHNINTVLYSAIGIGVFVILMTMIINIGVKLKEKDYRSALFSNNGVCGIIFFGGIVGGLVSMLMGKNIMNGGYILLLLVLPMIMMFMREPLGCWVKGKKFHIENGAVDFIASNFFECFEFVLGYATNTLSFVRVGGFVLSHAGMMAVVLSLSDMYPNASPVIIVIGNIFVMGLEGMLAGIQVLRLEFYEIFSRFYSSEGRPFEPVRIDLDKNIE